MKGSILKKGFIARLIDRDVPILQRLYVPEDRVAEGLAKWVNGLNGAPEIGEAISALKKASLALDEADHAIKRFSPAAGLLKCWMEGELDALRLCKYCEKKWFAAHRVDHEFCCDQCRISFNRKTPAAIEASRIRMANSREKAKVRARLTKAALERSEAREGAEKEATLAAAKRGTPSSGRGAPRR